MPGTVEYRLLFILLGVFTYGHVVAAATNRCDDVNDDIRAVCNSCVTSPLSAFSVTAEDCCETYLLQQVCSKCLSDEPFCIESVAEIADTSDEKRSADSENRFWKRDADFWKRDADKNSFWKRSLELDNDLVDTLNDNSAEDRGILKRAADQHFWKRGTDSFWKRALNKEVSNFWKRGSSHSDFWKRTAPHGQHNFWKRNPSESMFWKRGSEGNNFWKRSPSTKSFWKRGNAEASFWKRSSDNAFWKRARNDFWKRSSEPSRFWKRGNSNFWKRDNPSDKTRFWKRSTESALSRTL